MKEQPASLYTAPDAVLPDQRGFAVETLKSRLQKKWTDGFSRPWDNWVLVFSLVSAVVYVVETYSEDTTTPLWSQVVEFTVASFFICDYAIRFYLAENRCKFCMRPSSVLDMLCILPVLFIFTMEREDDAQQFIFFLQFLRVVRLVRILRGYRAVTVSKRGDPDNLKRQLNILIYTLLTLIFITAALLHLVEKYARVSWWDDAGGVNELGSFHDAVYFVVITLTTVGYGDITPKTAIGRGLVMVFVTASVVIIPRESGKLSELMALTSPYAGAFTNEEKQAHILVGGHVEFLNLRSFLMEFFHSAHGHHQMQVLVMSPSPPSKTVKLLFGQNGLFGDRVQFFEGSALDEADLTRMRYRSASACFFLADKLSNDPHLADCETIMRVLSAKNCSAHVPVFAQLLLSESKEQVVTAGADYVVCLRELKMHILATSSLVHGFSTLFCNLFRNEDYIFDKPGHWLSEYCHGISYEVYTLTRFPSCMVGKKFSVVACFIYQKWGSLLFGVQATAPGGGRQPMLNPISTVGASYYIQQSDSGFIFAVDSSITEEIERFDGEVAFLDANTSPPQSRGPSLRNMSKVSKDSSVLDRRSFSKPLGSPTDSSRARARDSRAEPPQLTFEEEVGTPNRTVGFSDLMPADSPPPRFGFADSEIPTFMSEGSLVSHRQNPLRFSSRHTAKGCVVVADSPAEKDILDASGTLSSGTAKHHRSIIKNPPPLIPAMKRPKHKVMASCGELPPLIPLGGVEDCEDRLRHEKIIDHVPADIGGHIVAVTHDMSSLLHFVALFRVDVSRSARTFPIVCVVPRVPEPDLLRTCLRYPEVFFIIGSGKEKSDFVKCGCVRARTCVILFSGTIGKTNLQYPSEYDGSGEEMMADFDAISTLACVRAVCQTPCQAEPQRPFTIVELVHKQNARFLHPKHSDENGKITESNDYIVPSYAGGNVYSDAVMDSLLCQVFYNHDLLLILRLFLNPGPLGDGAAEEFFSSKVFSLSTPPELAGSTFGELLIRLLINESVLPIGLFRAPAAAAPPPLASCIPYVFLCPSEDTIVHAHDVLFVLAERDPQLHAKG
ncbi:Calcium-activated potassium channel slowpoke [Diplonema papillatum]|nr:Calcium-activated potassium channel slowpoke [Diplonema papillatum]